MMLFKKCVGVLCLSLLTLSCAKEKPSFAPSITARIIQPGYQFLAEQTSLLAKTADTACNDATINAQDLKKLRHEWLVAMSAWEQAQVFRFGPVESASIRSQFQYWPDQHNAIGKSLKTLFARDTLLTAIDIDQAGDAAQGLSALEYLLFDKENTGELFGAKGIAAEQRCFYLQHNTQKLATASAAMAKEWSPEGEYRQLFTQHDNHNLAVAAVLDSLVSALEIIKTDKIAAPSGFLSEKQRPNVYLSEAWRSRESLALIRANMFVLGNILDAPQAGLLSLLETDSANKALIDKVRNQLFAVNLVLQRLNIRFNESLKSENGIAALNDLHNSIDALLKTCKTELPKALGVTLKTAVNEPLEKALVK